MTCLDRLFSGEWSGSHKNSVIENIVGQAKQGDQLLERVELAKGIYAELLKEFQNDDGKP